jgi:hypothetical protein
MMTIIWDDDTDYEMRRNVVILKVKMRYIELDLVVPTADDFKYVRSGNLKQIDEALKTLTPEERRRTTRKFRKQERKIFGGKKFDKISRSRKRSGVYTHIWRDVWKALEIKTDEDLIGNLASLA